VRMVIGFEYNSPERESNKNPARGSNCCSLSPDHAILPVPGSTAIGPTGFGVPKLTNRAARKKGDCNGGPARRGAAKKQNWRERLRFPASSPSLTTISSLLPSSGPAGPSNLRQGSLADLGFVSWFDCRSRTGQRDGSVSLRKSMPIFLMSRRSVCG
jgi:hypothetical protein